VSDKFVEFTNAATKQPILVNVDHIHTAEAVAGQKRVRLVMGGGDQGVHAVTLEDEDFKSIREVLTGVKEFTFRPK
jgi:hypothetical protein